MGNSDNHSDHLNIHFSLTPKSGNDKTGPIPVSTSPMGTCPPSCALRRSCYAKGRMLVNWLRLSDGNLTSGECFSDFCRSIRNLPESVTLWRHNQAGDLPGRNGRLHKGRCLQLADANRAGGRNRGGFTFTHYPVLASQDPTASQATLQHNREVIAEMNRRGFTVNLSADTMADVDALAALDIAPVVVLLPRDAERGGRTDGGHKVTVCPAARNGHDTKCSTCGLCQRQGRRPVIGFPAHGARVRMADGVARSGDCQG